MYTELCELPHPATPAQSQREGGDESLQMGGSQVPTDSLTAGANTMRSLVGFRPEEWVGRRGCGREDSGQAKNLVLQHFTKIPEGKLCTLYPELANQPFLLCLIPNWIHCPKCRGLLCFFQKFHTATLRAMGYLAAVLCFPGFQLSIEIPHLPTYFYRKPI